MVGAKVLVTDDDRLTREVLRDVLGKAGFQVTLAVDGQEAIKTLQQDTFDLILLDIMMPRMSGYEVCKLIRQRSKVPIVMLTSIGDTESVVSGLDYGADDYVIKPFKPTELVARLRAVLRRAGEGNRLADNVVLDLGDLVIDRRRHRVSVRGQEIALSKTEFELLSYLAANRGDAIERDELLNKVWGAEFSDETKLVDVCIHRLRQKIELDPARPDYVLTVRGVGYTLSAALSPTTNS